MRVVRASSHQSNFTIIENRVIRDDRLSYRARGILLYLLSQRDGWRVDATRIAAAGGEGRDAVRTALRELEGVGYVRYLKQQSAGGRWSTEMIVSEIPLQGSAPDSGNQTSADPASGDQASGSQASNTSTETKDWKEGTYEETRNASTGVAERHFKITKENVESLFEAVVGDAASEALQDALRWAKRHQARNPWAYIWGAVTRVDAGNPERGLVALIQSYYWGDPYGWDSGYVYQGATQ